MDHDLLDVTLAGPAKIAGKRHPAGATVSVSAAMAGELDAAGLLKQGPLLDVGPARASALDEAIERAVDARMAEREAVAQDNLEKLIAAHRAELAAAVERAEVAEARVSELEATIAADTNTKAGGKPAGKKA